MSSITNLKFTFALSLILVFFGLGWSQQTLNDKPGITGVYGEIKEGLYTNSVFKFQIQFPDDWIVLENEEAKEFMKAGINIAEIDEKALEKNEKYRVSLLSLLKKPMGNSGNATVALSAMKQPTASVSPLAVANLTRKGLSESPVIRFDTEPKLVNIGRSNSRLSTTR